MHVCLCADRYVIRDLESGPERVGGPQRVHLQYSMLEDMSWLCVGMAEFKCRVDCQYVVVGDDVKCQQLMQKEALVG